MNTNPTSAIVHICIYDIHLLLIQMMQMGIAEKLDANFPTHNNWEGISLGWTAKRRLTHILYASHRLNKVQNEITKHKKTISALTGLTIRALDVSSDRLAAILRYLNQDESGLRIRTRPRKAFNTGIYMTFRLR